MSTSAGPKRERKQGVSRREFIRQAGAGVLGAAALGGLGAGCFGDDEGDGPGPATSKERPYILFITTDQEQEPRWHRHDDAWLAEKLPGRTWLKEHGVHFTNAHANTLPCSPSRATIYTGLYSHQHQIYGNNGFDGNALQGFPSMARVLREKYDYKTFYLGKSHLAAMQSYECRQDATLGMDIYGFSEWVTAPSGPMVPTSLWPEKVCYDSPGIPGEGSHEDEEFTDAALKWLDTPEAKDVENPWFTVFSLVNPHDIAFYPRFEPPKNRTDKLGIGKRPGNWESEAEIAARKPSCQGEYETFYNTIPGGPMPEQGPRADEKWVGMVSAYYHLIMESDEHLVAIIKGLLALPARVRNNLVVVFTSDHGELCGAHGQRGKGPCMYEEQMNVPLYVVDFSALTGLRRFERRTPKTALQKGRYVETPGVKRDQLVCHLDMTATMVTLGANHEASDREAWRRFASYDIQRNGRQDVVCASQIQGKNLEPLLRDSGKDAAFRDYLLATHDWFINPTDDGKLSVSTAYHILSLRKQGSLGDYKLNLNYDWQTETVGGEELVKEELDNDPVAPAGIRAAIDWATDLKEGELYDMNESDPDLLEVNNLIPRDLPTQLRAKKHAASLDQWAKEGSLASHQADLESIAADLTWHAKVDAARKESSFTTAEKVEALEVYATLKHELIQERLPKEIRKELPEDLHAIQRDAWKAYRDGKNRGECEALTGVGLAGAVCVGL